VVCTQVLFMLAECMQVAPQWCTAALLPLVVPQWCMLALGCGWQPVVLMQVPCM